METMNCENTKYAVVKFLLDSTYSEIPTTWLFKDYEDIQQCWWPPRTANSVTLIANCTSPNSNTWHQYEVEIVKYCCEYLHLYFVYISQYIRK